MAVSSTPLPPVLLGPNIERTTVPTYFRSASALTYSFCSHLGSVPSSLHVYCSREKAHRRFEIVASAKRAEDVVSSQQERELRERYGFDVREILDESSPKKRRQKEQQGRKGRKKEVPVVEPPPPRTTHRLLQVLSGTAKRKKLLSATGLDVRPMMEVVKGAAFDIIQVAGGCPASLRPGRWLDLYSGTGSVGIEALSRGCAEAHFVEMDPWVVSDVLQPNLSWTDFLDASKIHTVRVENFLEGSEVFIGEERTFDYISVTPPYEKVDYSVLMNLISKSSVIGPDTFMLVEYPSRTSMLDSCGCLTKIVDRRFGRTYLAIYGPTWAQKKRKPKY